MYGWRGKIGIILPSLNNTMEYELNRLAPEGVIVLATRVLLEKGLPENLKRMTEQVDQAADLLKTAEVDCILFACTSGSFVNGLGWDEAFIERIESRTGIPAVTTMSSVVQVFQSLGIRSLSIATPYVDEVNRLAQCFFEQIGISVLSIEGLQCVSGGQLHNIPSTTAYTLASRVNHPDAEAIFISCTDFPSIGVINSLERDTGKTVVSSNIASLWGALKKIGVTEVIDGYGKILRS